MLLGVAAVIMFVLPSINPPAAAKDPIDIPGNLVATIVWPEGPTDVDLWVAGPSDRAVGYSNKSGRIWSLLRDDLGTANDSTPINMESAFTRGLPDGEYVVNVRCFGCAGRVPVPVNVEIRLADGAVVWRGFVDLVADKQERTALRWLMAGGAVVVGSESQVFRDIRGEG
ncbi:hypothetical protein CO676_30260 [Sinorhizobium sp. BJ1]|nr:hypothetical protein CO676_30260 [Sinorhizobium sp. BJ1]